MKKIRPLRDRLTAALVTVAFTVTWEIPAYALRQTEMSEQGGRGAGLEELTLKLKPQPPVIARRLGPEVHEEFPGHVEIRNRATKKVTFVVTGDVDEQRALDNRERDQKLHLEIIKDLVRQNFVSFFATLTDEEKAHFRESSPQEMFSRLVNLEQELRRFAIAKLTKKERRLNAEEKERRIAQWVEGIRKDKQIDPIRQFLLQYEYFQSLEPSRLDQAIDSFRKMIPIVLGRVQDQEESQKELPKEERHTFDQILSAELKKELIPFIHSTYFINPQRRVDLSLLDLEDEVKEPWYISTLRTQEVIKRVQRHKPATSQQAKEFFFKELDFLKGESDKKIHGLFDQFKTWAKDSWSQIQAVFVPSEKDQVRKATGTLAQQFFETFYPALTQKVKEDGKNIPGGWIYDTLGNLKTYRAHGWNVKVIDLEGSVFPLLSEQDLQPFELKPEQFPDGRVPGSGALTVISTQVAPEARKRLNSDQGLPLLEQLFETENGAPISDLIKRFPFGSKTVVAIQEALRYRLDSEREGELETMGDEVELKTDRLVSGNYFGRETRKLGRGQLKRAGGITFQALGIFALIVSGVAAIGLGTYYHTTGSMPWDSHPLELPHGPGFDVSSPPPSNAGMTPPTLDQPTTQNQLPPVLSPTVKGAVKAATWVGLMPSLLKSGGSTEDIVKATVKLAPKEKDIPAHAKPPGTVVLKKSGSSASIPVDGTFTKSDASGLNSYIRKVTIPFLLESKIGGSDGKWIGQIPVVYSSGQIGRVGYSDNGKGWMLLIAEEDMAIQLVDSSGKPLVNSGTEKPYVIHVDPGVEIRLEWAEDATITVRAEKEEDAGKVHTLHNIFGTIQQFEAYLRKYGDRDGKLGNGLELVSNGEIVVGGLSYSEEPRQGEVDLWALSLKQPLKLEARDGSKSVTMNPARAIQFVVNEKGNGETRIVTPDSQFDVVERVVTGEVKTEGGAGTLSISAGSAKGASAAGSGGGSGSGAGENPWKKREMATTVTGVSIVVPPPVAPAPLSTILGPKGDVGLVVDEGFVGISVDWPDLFNHAVGAGVKTVWIDGDDFLKSSESKQQAILKAAREAKLKTLGFMALQSDWDVNHVYGGGARDDASFGAERYKNLMGRLSQMDLRELNLAFGIHGRWDNISGEWNGDLGTYTKLVGRVVSLVGEFDSRYYQEHGRHIVYNQWLTRFEPPSAVNGGWTTGGGGNTIKNLGDVPNTRVVVMIPSSDQKGVEDLSKKVQGRTISVDPRQVGFGIGIDTDVFPDDVSQAAEVMRGVVKDLPTVGGETSLGGIYFSCRVSGFTKAGKFLEGVLHSTPGATRSSGVVSALPSVQPVSSALSTTIAAASGSGPGGEPPVSAISADSVLTGKETLYRLLDPEMAKTSDLVYLKTDGDLNKYLGQEWLTKRIQSGAQMPRFKFAGGIALESNFHDGFASFIFVSESPVELELAPGRPSLKIEAGEKKALVWSQMTGKVSVVSPQAAANIHKLSAFLKSLGDKYGEIHYGYMLEAEGDLQMSVRNTFSDIGSSNVSIVSPNGKIILTKIDGSFVYTQTLHPGHPLELTINRRLDRVHVDPSGYDGLTTWNYNNLTKFDEETSRYVSALPSVQPVSSAPSTAIAAAGGSGPGGGSPPPEDVVAPLSGLIRTTVFSPRQLQDLWQNSLHVDPVAIPGFSFLGKVDVEARRVVTVGDPQTVQVRFKMTPEEGNLRVDLPDGKNLLLVQPGGEISLVLENQRILYSGRNFELFEKLENTSYAHKFQIDGGKVFIRAQNDHVSLLSTEGAFAFTTRDQPDIKSSLQIYDTALVPEGKPLRLQVDSTGKITITPDAQVFFYSSLSKEKSSSAGSGAGSPPPKKTSGVVETKPAGTVAAGAVALVVGNQLMKLADTVASSAQLQIFVWEPGDDPTLFGQFLQTVAQDKIKTVWTSGYQFRRNDGSFDKVHLQAFLSAADRAGIILGFVDGSQDWIKVEKKGSFVSQYYDGFIRALQQCTFGANQRIVFGTDIENLPEDQIPGYHQLLKATILPQIQALAAANPTLIAGPRLYRFEPTRPWYMKTADPELDQATVQVGMTYQAHPTAVFQSARNNGLWKLADEGQKIGFGLETMNPEKPGGPTSLETFFGSEEDVPGVLMEVWDHLSEAQKNQTKVVFIHFDTLENADKGLSLMRGGSAPSGESKVSSGKEPTGLPFVAQRNPVEWTQEMLRGSARWEQWNAENLVAKSDLLSREQENVELAQRQTLKAYRDYQVQRQTIERLRQDKNRPGADRRKIEEELKNLESALPVLFDLLKKRYADQNAEEQTFLKSINNFLKARAEHYKNKVEDEYSRLNQNQRQLTLQKWTGPFRHLEQKAVVRLDRMEAVRRLNDHLLRGGIGLYIHWSPAPGEGPQDLLFVEAPPGSGSEASWKKIAKLYAHDKVDLLRIEMQEKQIDLTQLIQQYQKIFDGDVLPLNPSRYQYSSMMDQKLKKLRHQIAQAGILLADLEVLEARQLLENPGYQQGLAAVQALVNGSGATSFDAPWVETLLNIASPNQALTLSQIVQFYNQKVLAAYQARIQEAQALIDWEEQKPLSDYRREEEKEREIVRRNQLKHHLIDLQEQVQECAIYARNLAYGGGNILPPPARDPYDYNQALLNSAQSSETLQHVHENIGKAWDEYAHIVRVMIPNAMAQIETSNAQLGAALAQVEQMWVGVNASQLQAQIASLNQQGAQLNMQLSGPQFRTSPILGGEPMNWQTHMDDYRGYLGSLQKTRQAQQDVSGAYGRYRNALGDVIYQQGAVAEGWNGLNYQLGAGRRAERGIHAAYAHYVRTAEQHVVDGILRILDVSLVSVDQWIPEMNGLIWLNQESLDSDRPDLFAIHKARLQRQIDDLEEGIRIGGTLLKKYPERKNFTEAMQSLSRALRKAYQATLKKIEAMEKNDSARYARAQEDYNAWAIVFFNQKIELIDYLVSQEKDHENKQSLEAERHRWVSQRDFFQNLRLADEKVPVLGNVVENKPWTVPSPGIARKATGPLSEHVRSVLLKQGTNLPDGTKVSQDNQVLFVVAEPTVWLAGEFSGVGNPNPQKVALAPGTRSPQEEILRMNVVPWAEGVSPFQVDVYSGPLFTPQKEGYVTIAGPWSINPNMVPSWLRMYAPDAEGKQTPKRMVTFRAYNDQKVGMGDGFPRLKKELVGVVVQALPNEEHYGHLEKELMQRQYPGSEPIPPVSQQYMGSGDFFCPVGSTFQCFFPDGKGLRTILVERYTADDGEKPGETREEIFLREVLPPGQVAVSVRSIPSPSIDASAVSISTGSTDLPQSLIWVGGIVGVLLLGGTAATALVLRRRRLGQSVPSTGLEEVPVNRRTFLGASTLATLGLVMEPFQQLLAQAPLSDIEMEIAQTVRGCVQSFLWADGRAFLDRQQIRGLPPVMPDGIPKEALDHYEQLRGKPFSGLDFNGLYRSYNQDSRNSGWEKGAKYFADNDRVFIYDTAVAIEAEVAMSQVDALDGRRVDAKERFDRARTAVSALIELAKNEQSLGFTGGWHFSYNTKGQKVWIDPRAPMGGTLWAIKAIYEYIRIALKSSNLEVVSEARGQLTWVNDLVRDLVFEMQVTNPKLKGYGLVHAMRYNSLLDEKDPATGRLYNIDQIGQRAYEGSSSKTSGEIFIFEHAADLADVFALAGILLEQEGLTTKEEVFLKELALRYKILGDAMEQDGRVGDHYRTALGNNSVAVDNNTWLAQTIFSRYGVNPSPQQEDHAWAAIEYVWKEFRTKGKDGKVVTKVGDLVLEDVSPAIQKMLANRDFVGLFFFKENFSDPFVDVPSAERPKLEQMVQAEATAGYIHFLIEFAKTTKNADRRKKVLDLAGRLHKSLGILRDLYRGGTGLPYATNFVGPFSSLRSMAATASTLIVEARIRLLILGANTRREGRKPPEPYIGFIGIQPPASFKLTPAMVSRSGLEEMHLGEVKNWNGVNGNSIGQIIPIQNEQGQMVGRVVVPDLKRIRLTSAWNPQVMNDNFPKWQDPTVPFDQTEVRQLQKAGQPFDEWKEQAKLPPADILNAHLSFLANGQQSNFNHPYGPLVHDYRVVRQRNALDQYPIDWRILQANGSPQDRWDDAFWAMVLEADQEAGARLVALRFRREGDKEIVDQELRDPTIQNGSPTVVSQEVENPGVKFALIGPPLIFHGEDVSKQIRSNLLADGSRRELRPNEVTWDPKTTQAAFSAIGKRPDGQLVQVSIIEQITVAQLSQILIQMNLTDAILLGGSGDVHQFVYGQEDLSAEGRVGSERPGKSRALNVVLAGYELQSTGLEEMKPTGYVLLTAGGVAQDSQGHLITQVPSAMPRQLRRGLVDGVISFPSDAGIAPKAHRIGVQTRVLISEAFIDSQNQLALRGRFAALGVPADNVEFIPADVEHSREQVKRAVELKTDENDVVMILDRASYDEAVRNLLGESGPYHDRQLTVAVVEAQAPISIETFFAILTDPNLWRHVLDVTTGLEENGQQIMTYRIQA